MTSKHELIKLRNLSFLYTLIIVVLMGLLIFVFLILPFIRHLLISEKTNFLNNSRDRSQILELYLLKYKDIAKQIASRIRIRDKLEEYNKGKLSIEELTTFTIPKLQYIISQSNEIKGIIRCAKNGKPLISIGKPIPREFLDKINENSIWISPPFKLNNSYYITLVSPIYNREKVRVGTDLILFDFEYPKNLILKPFKHFSEVALGIGGYKKAKPILFLSYFRQINDLKFLNIGIKKALTLKTSKLETVKINNLSPHLVYYRPLKNTGWVFVSTIDETYIFAPIKRVIRNSLFTVFVFIFLGIMGIGYIFYPLVKKIIKGYEELREEVSIKSLLLSEEMQKRKSVEEAYDLSVNILGAVFDAVPLPIVAKDIKDKRYILVNESFLKLIGRDLNEVINKRACDIWGKERANSLEEIDNKVVNTKNMIIYEDYLEIPGKKKLYGIITKSPFFDKEGNVAGIVSTFFDLTERKKMEKELNLFASLVDQTSEYIVITDPEGSIEYVNPAFTKVTGYKNEEVIGKNPRILKSGKHSKEFYKELWDTIKGGRTWRGEFINRRKNGEEYYDRSVIFPIRDEDGNIINFAAIKQDITDEKIREKRLTQIEKMNTIGALTGGIAHDFNNLLTVILGYSDFIIKLSEENSPINKYAKKIEETGDKAKELTSKLLAFGRRQIYTPKVIDINEALLDIKKTLSRLIPEDIELNLKLSPDLPYIYADPIQLEQIVMNLVINARDALIEKEKIMDESYQKIITIETAKRYLDESYVRLHPGSRVGEFVLVSVSDNGIGMDQKTMDKIFEPFFTTKEEGRGTGLGLATVYGIVKQNSGMIYVYSEPLEGTTFKVYWPIKEGEKEVKKEEKIKDIRGNETILVVEDNDEVREFILKSLGELGYRVYGAKDGEEVIILLEREGITPELLITDVIMPKMDGEKLARKLKEFYPNMKVLFMSGYTYNHITHKGILKEGINFLHKPFSSYELASYVRKVLDEKSP